MIQFDEYFSNGLVQPPTRVELWVWMVGPIQMGLEVSPFSALRVGVGCRSAPRRSYKLGHSSILLVKVEYPKKRSNTYFYVENCRSTL